MRRFDCVMMKMACYSVRTMFIEQTEQYSKISNHTEQVNLEELVPIFRDKCASIYILFRTIALVNQGSGITNTIY